jgi:hypothetical protein
MNIKYVRGVRYHKEYTIYGHYGQGAEEVTTELTRDEAQARLKEYQDNEPQYLHTMKVKWVRG